MWEAVQPSGMVADGEVDTSRVAVKTYIPAFQKDEWQDHADQLGMSQSEFVRTMVQAGRRSFGELESEINNQQPGADSETSSSDELEDRVVEVLQRDQHLDWESLLEALTDNIENRLEEVLAELQDENVVRYSGRHGGYTLIEQ